MKTPWDKGSLFGPHRRRERGLKRLGRAAIIVVAAGVIAWLIRDQAGFVVAVYEGKRAVDRHDFAAAREAFQRAWHVRPQSALMYDCAGFLALQEQAKGWKNAARGNYIQARERRLRSNFLINHVKEARRLLDAGRYEQAETELEHALLLSPRNATANLLQGHLLYAQGRLAKAIEQYQKALTLAYGSAEIQSTLARVQEAKSKGSIPYILDRNGAVLAALDVTSRLPTYPSDFLTAQLVGYRSSSHGYAGLEAALEDKLGGNVVTLTIDVGLQRIADAALGWQKGSIVVLNPQTGEILAAVSHPSFRPSLVDKNWGRIMDNQNEPLKNRAMEGLYEPGSIAKIITSAAIMETKTDVTSLYPFKCKGYVMIGNETFWDWKRHNMIPSFSEAFNQSCNVGIARMVHRLGAASLIQFLRSFGFSEDDHIPLDLPVAKSKAPLELESQTALASAAIGLGRGFRITPLHAAMLAAAVANGGVMMSPILVKEVRSVTGAVIRTAAPHPYKIAMKKETAAALTKYMVDFVHSGIGRKARMIRYQVAGKTGTSGSSKHGLNGWFICFAPANKPELAAAILCENGGAGHAVAAPLAQRLLSEALK